MKAGSPPGSTFEQNDDALIDALTNVLRVLLKAMDGLALISRQLQPSMLDSISGTVGPLSRDLEIALAQFRDQIWPGELNHMTQSITLAGAEVDSALNGLIEIEAQTEGMFHAYRALRYAPRAAEALYPLAAHIPALSQYFLEPHLREDENLTEALTAPLTGEHNTGVLHAGNEKHERGGFSIYVPENYDAERTYPVITALHGGSGHGRTFLWSWLRNARSRGAILLSPTSMDRTWSLMQPEADGANILGILDMVQKQWNVDEKRLLLTGMSDGGTFSYLIGGAKNAPFTHLAPISASFQPMLLEFWTRNGWKTSRYT